MGTPSKLGGVSLLFAVKHVTQRKQIKLRAFHYNKGAEFLLSCTNIANEVDNLSIGDNESKGVL